MLERKKYIRVIIGLGVALAVMMVAALCMGRFSMNPSDVMGVFTAKLNGGTPDESMETILFKIRLPRVLAAALIGAALSLSGTAYQSTFRNPLISPDLLGVSSGASLGAAFAILLGASLQITQAFAFVGGIIAVLMTTSMPRLLRNSSNMTLVLSGIIVTGFMDALIGVIKLLSREQDQLASIVFWQMGSLSHVNTSQLLSIVPPILVCLVIMFLLSWRLNILSFGEQEAQTVGINVTLLRGVIIVCASLLTASAVSVSGTIRWIGLIIPHFGRLICGSDNTKLIPTAALLGGAFLLVIDTLARTMTSIEIPLSILSGLVGAPLFAWLLFRQKAKML